MVRGTYVLAICLAAVACRQSAKEAPLKAASTVAGTPSAAQAVVTAKQGKVELLRGADGSVTEARVGDRLGTRDVLRTDIGEADLSVEGVKVRVHEASRLELKHIGLRDLRARVRGSVESEVDSTGKLDVEMENSDAVAHSDGGHFFITADGRGVVAVASVTGTVHLSGGGKSVEVQKGEVSHIGKSADAPSLPAAALRRVLLSVQWPNQKETNQSTLPIAGRVEPGSRVFVQGQPVVVEAGGSFRAEVPLKQGRQKIAVVTVDALGRRKEVESVVLRDDSLPDVRVKKKLWQWRR